MGTTLTIKGQVTIPKNIRDYLRLAPGDRVDFRFSDDGAVQLVPLGVQRPSREPGKFDALVGSRRNGGDTAAVMELLRGYSEDKDDPGLR